MKRPEFINSASGSEYAVITGASGLMGAEFARQWAKPGRTIYLLGRQIPKLQKLAKEIEERGATPFLIEIDLTERNQILKFAYQLKSKNIKIHLLINCAGFGSKGRFVEANLIQQLDMVRVNCEAVVALTSLLLPLLPSGQGKIINVSSMAAFQPGPLNAVYFSSKSFVNHFTAALRFEMRDQNLKILTLCPGPVCSEEEEQKARRRPGLFRPWRVMTARQVVSLSYKALNEGKEIYIPGWANQLIVFFARLLPNSLVMPMVSRIMLGRRS